MASDSSGLYIFGFILLLIIGVIAYSVINKRLTDDKRRQLIKAFKASPTIAKNAPILVQGQAKAPDLLLPTTGEHVAFYSMFVLSKESAITDTHTSSGIRINGIPLGTGGPRIDSVEGFSFFETSGDFTVASGGTCYFVRPSGVLAYFKSGADLVSGFVGGQFKKTGLPESFFNDTMNVQAAQPALKMLCDFKAPLLTERSRRISGAGNSKTTTQHTTFSVVTATSRIDSRVHHFVSGFNLPPGVLELITKRGIELPKKEEILVVETFIPLNREVFVFGTFDGDRSIIYADGTVQLSVSYTDPSLEK
ncbi:MAG: hypothetical protein Q8R70_11125 [Methanoregula sp.]|nr:hypothetical protein [Methanoregula sp.]